MLFTDPIFLFYFLPACLLLLRFITLGERLTIAAKGFIVSATLVFYAYQNWVWPLLFLVVVTTTWIGSWAISSTQKTTWRRCWLILSVLACLLTLVAFKYLNWLSQLLPFLHPLQAKITTSFGTAGVILLPAGISFYVFEALSFTIDQYRRKVTLPSPLTYLTFLAMFPRFIAGPIVRYSEVQRQLMGWRGMMLARGLTLFAIGFGLKILGADQFAVFVPYAFGVAQPDFVQAWAGTLAYSFQLYLDFWGYSLMATGLGLCLGFEFPDNFRSPYSSDSIGAFWRRWHITLSSWVRDYIYIALGGSHVSRSRLYFNLILAMTLVGLWHGASFTFLVWGLYHGLLLAIERSIGEARLAFIPRALRVTLTFLLVTLGWVLFRSADFSQARSVYLGMIGAHGLGPQFNPSLLVKQEFAALLCVAGLLFVSFYERKLISAQPISARDFSLRTQILVGFGFFIALLVNASSVQIPFLYFQF